MIDLLGLPGLKVIGATETLANIDFDVELEDRPRCADHPDLPASEYGAEKPILAVADVPMRGKAVRLTQHRKQFNCPECGKRVNARSPQFHVKRAKTLRLIRYVENAILRRPATDIAQETGLTAKEISLIADDLYDRLEGFRFATPDVVAMDAVHFTRTRIYQIVSNGRTGAVLGIFRDGDAAMVADRLGQIVDMREVRVFVTDMHKTNITVAKTFRGDRKPIHVADKFHVLEKCNDAVFSIVGDQIEVLKQRGHRRSEKALRSMQPMLAGRRTPAQRRDPMFAFEQPDLPKRWTNFALINAAHRARWQLHEFYRSDDRATALTRLEEFRRRARDPQIAERMGECLGYLDGHKSQILNYFDCLEFDADGSVWGPTTNAAERKNGDLQDLWHRSRGFPDQDTPKQLWLKAVFHAYKLDFNLVECADCGKFVGPLSEQATINRASIVGPPPPVHCGCRDEHRRPEPEPETAIDHQAMAA